MTKGHKQWISVQADGRLVAALDREAEARGISRSEAIRGAVEEWTRRAVEEDAERLDRAEGRHRQVMRRLEFIVGMIRQQERVAEQEAETAAKRNGKRSAGVSPEDPVDGYREAEDEDTEPRRSALDEARKRARRRAG